MTNQKSLDKGKGGKYSNVWLSSFPTEEILELYLNKCRENHSKLLFLSFPIGLERFEAKIFIK